ncbi:MAG: hypothetical protein IPP51_18150 [Bacteroidetes bacterium]|nr:hypothetical protein [Bacteroidota bacterium]
MPIASRILDIYSEKMTYYLSLDSKHKKLVEQEMNQALYILQALSQILRSKRIN